MSYHCDTKTFEFSAFRESDFTDGNIGRWSTFEMPDTATLNIAVEDNDSYLSGDSRWNENATDRSGQHASITADGEEIGNGGQIYAEKYMWLCDNFGNYYVMVEIEQEGTNEDYFTFYEPYGIPAPGTTLTVVGSGNITTCGWNPRYDDLGGGETSVPGALNGRYFFDTDGSDTDNGEDGVVGVQVTITNVDNGETFTTMTDDDGSYSFIGLGQGDYTVTFAEVDGFGFVTAGQGGDAAIDSDVDSTGTTMTISIGSGEVVTDIDAGIRPCGDIDGSAGVDDVLIGCDTDDHIRGFSGDDTIEGRGGNDIINLGRGDDIAIGGTGDDMIDGGEGTDVAVFSGNAADYMITVTSPDGSTAIVSGADGTDALVDIELLRFSDQDILVSSFILSASDDIADLPAVNADVIVDVLANDNAGLAGGTPSVMSVTDGKFGTATIGADGQITYTATADATGGFDVISYTIVDSEGRMATAEVLIGDIAAPDASAANAVLLDDTGVTFVGSGIDEIIIGGLGNDTITGKGGDDGINGGAGNDVIAGSAGDDTIIGGDGDDELSGNLGNDLISGGAGNDDIAGSGGDDQIIGGDGNDVISANPGDDFIFAGAGDDEVSGNAGNELIFAGQGNDLIKRIGEGQDTAFGGDGDDVFIWRSFQADVERDLIDGQSGLDTLELEVDAADFAAVQAEVDAYTASLAANAGDTNGVSSSYSFTTIALDIANIETIDLTFG